MKLTTTLRRLTASMFFATSLASAVAAPLTPAEALARLNGDRTGLRMSRGSQYELAYTETAGNDNVLYVFNTGSGGFIIASADDRLPAQLGYSDSGNFDPANLPPQLKGWLKGYADEAAYFFNHEDEYTNSPSTRATRADIPAMLSTQWNQAEPYNLDCPEAGGIRCVTGCVATAMAQVIKYHNYPVTGSGTHEYQWNGQTLSFDYGNTVFDYANMLDTYDGSATEDQNKAVANLMYACGVGVDMDYSPGESAAFDLYIPQALKTYFNYDPGVRMLKKIYYSNEEWDDLVYDELAAGRPVIYSGQAHNGGHEFVCDGYSDGYFHINWGWGGYCDGLFLLSALNPDGQGIGGFAGGYNSDQGMICGIKPATGGAATPWYQIYVENGLSVKAVYGSTLSISCNIFNYSPEPETVDFYLKVVSESGEVTYSDEGASLSFPGANGGNVSGYYGFSVNIPTGLSAGSYKAYLVMKTPDGNFQNVLVPQSGAAYFDMTVGSDGEVTFTNGQPAQKAQIWVEKFSVDGIIQTNQSVRVNLFVKNTGDIEYSGVFEGNVYKHGTEEKVDRIGINISVAAYGDFDGYVNHTFPMEDGEYDVIFFDMYGDKISDTFTLWIGTPPATEVTSIALDRTEATIVEGESITLTATVDPETATDKTVVWSSSDNEVATVENGVVTTLKPGTVTITAETANGLKATCTITVTAKVIEVTGISLDKTEATLVEGESLTLTATVDPETATDKTITWSSSDNEVATVENGVVTTLKPGTVTITAETANGLKATCTITVTAKVIEVTGIALDRTEATLVEGESLTLTATVDPETATDKTVTWSSSDNEVATVENGVVTALKPGTVTITAETANGLKATCTITVTAKVIEVTGIALDRTEATLVEGESLTLTATVDPENATDKTVTWSSSDTEVATVDNGVVTALKPGTVTITAETANGLKATCTITVTAKVIEVTGIALDRTEATLVEGESITLTATVDPETATDKTVVWSSSDTEVATVENGVVTTLKPGTVTITAETANGLKATCTITVTAKVILATSISLDKESIEAVEGTTVQLTATVLPDDTTDKSVIWTSSDTNIATVDENGLVTIIGVGSATITVSTNDGSDLTATCQIFGTSGIEAIIAGAGAVDVYTTSGIVVKLNADAGFISNLKPGIYIIRAGNKTWKIAR